MNSEAAIVHCGRSLRARYRIILRHRSLTNLEVQPNTAFRGVRNS